MKVRLTLLGAAVVLCTSVMAQQPPTPQPAPAAAQAPQAPPLRVFIQAGLKTHAEGQHDYPQFLADWSKLLTNRGRHRRRRAALSIGARARGGRRHS